MKPPNLFLICLSPIFSLRLPVIWGQLKRCCRVNKHHSANVTGFNLMTWRAGIIVACSLIWPGSARAEEPQWPFYSLAEVNPGEVKQSKWVRNSIDAFILKQLEDAELSPASEATRRQLVRRLYFDLIGLPPTPEEVEAFVADDSEGAYERLVDDLLKDPRYGEHWARLWLDLARYADTAGYEGDPDLPHAWRYRDYVIDAFNNDKPYDLFVKEQIAGDEFANIMGAGDLPGVPPENVVALTFLRLAPFTEPRGDETRHELLSEITSTVSSVFLGLTVGCAKCHDHKYDNIPTKDFYRLKAFFSTVSLQRPEPGDGFQIGGSLPAGFYRPSEEEWAKRRKAKVEQQMADASRELSELKKQLEERLGTGAGFGLQAMGGPLGNNYVFEQSKVNDGKLHVSTITCDGEEWEFYNDGNGPGSTGRLSGRNQGQWFGDLTAPKHVSLGQYSAGTGTAKEAHHVGHFAEVLIYDHVLEDVERKAVGEYVDSRYSGAKPSTQLPREGLEFWLDAADLDADMETSNPEIGQRVSSWRDRVSGSMIAQDDESLQPVMDSIGEAKAPAVRFNSDFLVGPVGEAGFLDDQQGTIVVVYTATHSHEGYGFEVGGDGVFLSTLINPEAAAKSKLDDAIADTSNELISNEERERYRRLSTRDPFLKQQLKRLQPLAMSLRHSYGPPYEPGVPTSRVMIRGEYDNPGEVVEAGFLSCITGHQDPAPIRLDPFKRWPTRSRRMALAEWIASADNPVASRVMVNRLWHWHFGRGIVRTPSDLGALSSGPSHPELLDWLAWQFVKEKWSIKAVHRLIVTSATFRQTSSHTNKHAEQIDPENTLLWRFRRRRLEAEAIRDSVLAASGRLNPEQFGLPIFPPLPDGIEERVKYSNSKWDTQYGPEGRKRSIYIYQQRTMTMPHMQVFDALVCDESRPRRQHSVTPLQALAMYNGAFVNEETRHFAERVRRDAGTDVSRQIGRAFQIALGRQPTEEELTQFIELANDTETGLVGVCRVLLNSNEFIYID
ncbi:MAG: hypothetical protein CMJ64_04405 [Planctomycetaceae bacterium]|nr:hypothetical protein [Planctomycetaceae bacterium]